MKDTIRIESALKFLKDNKGFDLGNLFMSCKGNEIFVSGYTNFSDTKFMNKRIALEELEVVKLRFEDYKSSLREFADFVADKRTTFYLSLDYGMGSITICEEVNGKLNWHEKLLD